jgi:mono/diheme cytochrome c family protein
MQRGFLTFLLATGCGDRVERVLAKEGDPAAGAEVWNDHCVTCHAVDGTGTDNGPDLTDEPESSAELADKILYGWGEMEGFEQELTNQEVADLLAYLEETVLP